MASKIAATRESSRRHSPNRAPDLERHRRKCSICRHPERENIELDFLHWQSPEDIAENYKIPDRRYVYTHAYAAGLFARRKRNLGSALEHIIERVADVKVTASDVVRALRAYCCLTDDGLWIEPPRRVQVTRVSAPRPRSPVSSCVQPPIPDRQSLNSNHHTAGLENDATH